jgi:hypothetical protein
MPDSKSMEVNAMIVFASRYGVSEKLALAAGVGAVQARANIRVRRLIEEISSDEVARDAGWKENWERMAPEYISPREIDADWANVVILAAPTSEVSQEAALKEMNAYLRSLPNCGGKMAAVLTPCEAMLDAAEMAGFTVVPAPEGGFKDHAEATAFGKHVCEMARALKQSA